MAFKNFLPIFAAVSFAQSREVFKISSSLQNGTSRAQFTSGYSGLDGTLTSESSPPTQQPHIRRHHLHERIACIGAKGPPVLNPTQDSILIARLWVTCPNGTSWTTQAFADSATVIAQENVSSGQWHGTGFSWKARPNSGYRIKVDAPDVGVKGYITVAQVCFVLVLLSSMVDLSVGFDM